MTNDTFPCVVSGRITSRAKHIMDKEGFNVRDAVEWFVDHKCSPKKKMEVDKYFLEKEIEELKSQLKSKQEEYDDISNKLLEY